VIHQVEGPDLGTITAVLQFPSIDAARAFWNDPEYQPVVIIDGVETPAPLAQSPSATT